MSHPASLESSSGPVGGQPPVDVAAGLVFERGRLLIAQRPVGGHLAGCWEFPGGKLEPGETWQEGLMRELREELGIEVVVGELFEEVTHAYPTKTVHLRFHLCTLASGDPRAMGCADFRWVTREELGDFEFPPADARLLVRLAATAGLWTRPESGG